MPNCHHIFTHNDLDGAISVLAYMWSKPKEDSFSYVPVSNLQIPKLLREVQNTHNPSNITILDMGLREEFVGVLDKPYITFIDHHKSSQKHIEKFKHSKIIYSECTSNALLTYKTYKDSINATREQKLLIALADDHDSYKLKLPESYDLNLLFWNEYQNRFSDFINDYYNGFKPFTEKQKRAVAFLKAEASNEAEKLPIFYGEVRIGGKVKKACAAMMERIVPLVMDVLIKKYSPDLFFFINTKNEKVSIRQCVKEDPVDVGAFAEKICNGGGHENAAAGVITPLFMEITKNFRPI